MSKNKLLSALLVAAFSTVTFSAIAADHATPAKSDDATTNAASSKARPGMVKPSKAKKAKKHHKKAKKAKESESKSDETPVAK